MIIVGALLLALCIIVAVIVFGVGVLGSGLIMVFGDVVVFGLILWFIIKRIFRR